MIDYSDYNIICDETYIIGYKEEIVRLLKDNLKNFIDQNFPKDVLEEEVERLTIVRDCQYKNTDLIRVENRDEEKSHDKSKKIAKVSVLIPYHNGFSGKDVFEYLV